MFEPTRLLSKTLSRYLLAVAASIAALLLRVAIVKLIGHDLPTYITFYPPVMVIALLAGLWPGIVATASASALAAYFVIPPPGFHVHPDDAVGLVLFSGMGVFMSVVAERYRRTRLRVTAYEKELAIRESREALHRSEERWAITLRSIGDAVLTCDARGRITFLNPVAETLTGWSVEDATGQPIQSVFRIVNEQTGEPSEDIVGQALREGRAVELTNHTALLTRTGTSIPIEDSAAPIKDASGTVVGVVLVFHDVTERRRTQEALRKSEERLRASAMGAEIGVWYWSPGTNHVEVSANWRKLFGVAPDVDVTFETWRGAVHPDDRDRAVRELNAASDTHREFDVEYRALWPDGTVRWLVDRGRAWYDNSGQAVGMAGVNLDITSQKQAEQALRASEQRVRQKLESILLPEGNIESLELADIIDVPALQSMMEEFHEFARIPMAIIDLKGQVLVGVGWQDVCTKFHRVHPESCRHCIESDVELSAGVPQGDFKLYHCKNHMWDVATPIMVGGKHVGNVFTGQFFFEGETPDLEVFRAQAMRYGFDEQAYLAALDRVPRLKREQLTAAMGFFMRVAELISKLSYSNVKLARSLTQRDALTRSLRANEARLQRERDLLQTVMDGAKKSHLVFLDRHFNFVRVNETYARSCGYTPDEMVGKNHFALYPHEENEAIFASVRDTGLPLEFHDKPFVFPDQPGRGVTYWDWTLMPVKGDGGEVTGLVFSLVETTQRKRAEQQLRKLNRTLRALNNSNQALLHATDETDLLQKVCEIVVHDCEHAMVWIGYAEDDEARTVRPVAHVGFDDGYLESLRITWAETDRGLGPTGTAIRTGKPRVCHDMRTDPQFAPWREEALKRGYASSLALPIVGGSRTLGAITIYARETEAFSAEEVELLQELAGDLGYGLNALRLRAAHEKAEEQLRNSEERYRLLFENMAEGLAHCRMLFDEEGKPADFVYLDVNGAFRRLTGLENVAGKRVTEIIPGIKEAHPELFEIYGRVATTGKPERFEFEFTPLGVWLSVSAYSNHKEHFVAVFHDVTERKQAEQALQQALQKERARAEEIQTLMDSVPAAVWIAHDPLGTVITGNRSSYELLRLPFGVNASRTAPESERPTNFRVCKRGVEIPGHELPVQRAARGEVIRDHEFEIVFDDGTVRYFAGNGTPLNDAEGRPRGAVCVFMDITERKRAEEALIRSEKLASVGRMAATIAHEINNPLAAVMNTLYLAKTNLPSGGVAREYLDMADDELRRVAHLTRQALGFYRESSAPTPVCVSDVLHSAIRLLKNKTASKRARIVTECDESAQITGIAGELRQVLTNLLANSLDAVAEGGVVKARVSAKHTGIGGRRTVRITIADNGSGIHPSVLPHLFEPFFTTKEAAGTGLGLWVSRQIVEKHGGRIQVHSSKDGRHTGTTFSFVLPADAAAVPRRKGARAGA